MNGNTVRPGQGLNDRFQGAGGGRNGGLGSVGRGRNGSLGSAGGAGGSAIVCICGDDAMQLTVRKEGPNTGTVSSSERFVLHFTYKALMGGGGGGGQHMVPCWMFSFYAWLLFLFLEGGGGGAYLTTMHLLLTQSRSTFSCVLSTSPNVTQA